LHTGWLTICSSRENNFWRSYAYQNKWLSGVLLCQQHISTGQSRVLLNGRAERLAMLFEIPLALLAQSCRQSPALITQLTVQIDIN
jgi:hypothetical protein